ncbi:uncharacterized protein Z518_07825 [Rhinocladiella mackenziei CBS 650.93]|uniref:Xylanolytic transcriptional activator regulatory domain-containing protein n=1 Tax=Rhinocladiella mackenziei CBS 650.93 TaxID=1442369 RepID=A0A0D2IF45_9EURO|nr:uncharacterized protein Z518_07825 [Rhinocladiella mackenziei CBS 650.93]KIX01886.1 hypothetical protein Z518_07825 [Rhinocladiella mackenziei CBS 650.93]
MDPRRSSYHGALTWSCSSSEQKIDDIAKSVDGIKDLLQGLNVSPDTKGLETGSIRHPRQPELLQDPTKNQPISLSGSEHLWDHSPHIIDFLKAALESEGSRDAQPQADNLFSSLRSLVQTLEGPAAVRNLPSPQSKVTRYPAGSSMPPLEAVVAVLRWAKGHEANTRIAWLSRILPLETFADICRKVYFAVDDYTEVDLVLANGYLFYIFAEHVVVSGLQDYRGYCRLCHENLHAGLSQFPLLLPASMEVIAALTLGATHAVDSSKATRAWTFIAAASNLCQTLGYHRLHGRSETPQPLRAAQERLFWAVHRIDRGLSLRLGRPSTIRDADITLPYDPNELRSTKIAKIQGRVYDQLYSPVGLSWPDYERGQVAEVLADELRALINETHIEVCDASDHPSEGETDPMRAVYLRCELICQSSLLALILRAIPPAPGSLGGVSDDCVAVARETLDIHQQCMQQVRSCKSDPFMITKYLNWSILHAPFIPFSFLFTRAVQLLDVTDLARLDRFAASFRPEGTSSESTTHPRRLYELLCQTARIYIDSNTLPSVEDPAMSHPLQGSSTEFGFTPFGIGPGAAADETSTNGMSPDCGLSGWYYDNQQIMSLLDDDIIF